MTHHDGKNVSVDYRIERIRQLKKEKNAVILVHNYQLPEVQDIADHCGDSLELARLAAKTEASIIVFCGVYFMAEMASIICPDKKVLLPDPSSGCPMADMLTVEELREFKKQHPGAITIGYVNSSAAVKTELDYCCTSANAQKVIESLPKDKKILFVPDKYLGSYVGAKTGRDIQVWNGYCPTHAKMLPEYIQRLKREHPKAKVIAHPECTGEVLALSDAVLSTSGMLRYCHQESAQEFIVATEIGLIHGLRKKCPGKKFYPAGEQAVCLDMKRITIEKILHSLEHECCEVKVPADMQKKALKPIEKMLAIV